TVPERSARRDVVAAFRAWPIDECRRAVDSPALR
ncbi:transcriptional regulator, partial [Mesorhizobium sp. M2D.F.Ca.ET.145.01.1.1]